MLSALELLPVDISSNAFAVLTVDCCNSSIKDAAVEEFSLTCLEIWRISSSKVSDFCWLVSARLTFSLLSCAASLVIAQTTTIVRTTVASWRISVLVVISIPEFILPLTTQRTTYATLITIKPMLLRRMNAKSKYKMKMLAIGKAAINTRSLLAPYMITAYNTPYPTITVWRSATLPWLRIYKTALINNPSATTATTMIAYVQLMFPTDASCRYPTTKNASIKVAKMNTKRLILSFSLFVLFEISLIL